MGRFQNLLKLVFVLGAALINAASGMDEVFQQRVVVNASEVCVLPISPELFKWERQPGYVKQIMYNARLQNSPDLPGWLDYSYDSYTSMGYIYGVPPVHVISISLDVIAWNKFEGYDVRKLIISLEIMRKDPPEYIVELKVDNLNVKNLCGPRRMNELINVLSDQLSWGSSMGAMIVPVFMASAVALGENRIPLRPNEAEGVVVHFASNKDFSPELKKLQIEVLPLWKHRPCPRDLKRTSVEIHFRRANLLIDWCSFRLRTLSQSNGSEVLSGGGGGGKQDHTYLGGHNYPEGHQHNHNHNHHQNSVNPGGDGQEEDDEKDLPSEPLVFLFKSDIPSRSYLKEILLATVIPGAFGGMIGFIILASLWSERDEDSPIIKQRINGNGNRNGNNGTNNYVYHQPANQQDSGVVLLTRDRDLPGHSSRAQSQQLDPMMMEDRELMTTPLPPMYGETHPNGAPALIYAV